MKSLGDRMKMYYEDRSRNKLLRRTYTIIRVDGKAFHTYTRGLKQPFDECLAMDMNSTAIAMCKNIMGVKCAYVQSDEISFILTDFDQLNTEAWFDNNVQKIASVAASMATAQFNHHRLMTYFSQDEANDFRATSSHDTVGEHSPPDTDLRDQLVDVASILDWFPKIPSRVHMAMFDARVFQIPSHTEVINYLIWRRQDAIRNSISSVAQYHYSHKQLHGKNTSEMLQMIIDVDDNWHNYDPGFTHGRLVSRDDETKQWNVQAFDHETSDFNDLMEVLIPKL